MRRHRKDKDTVFVHAEKSIGNVSEQDSAETSHLDVKQFSKLLDVSKVSYDELYESLIKIERHIEFHTEDPGVVKYLIRNDVVKLLAKVLKQGVQTNEVVVVVTRILQALSRDGTRSALLSRY
eukprot:TRINITY_DN10326_c0_g3_i3.p1 TRINITY_DN10326_c0_g3~~TRINITY_DN10326_c0_g3_i3.p1  ORF type:complete len:123 (-),score=17.07 TRINITY_DN10326_c0_g3_i3:237-605(-)